MTNLLFPGRHHLLTNFQLSYLTLVTQGDIAQLRDVEGKPLRNQGSIDNILWAVTSANHSNTRRNPLPAYRRVVAIEEMGTQLDANSFTYLIDDIGSSKRFAEYVIKKIAVDSQGRFDLTPQNTVVASSTPEVFEQYIKLGFQILPVELKDRSARTFSPDPPWMVMDKCIDSGLRGEDWRTQTDFVSQVARATQRLYRRYDIGELILRLHRSPILTVDGDLTETRDYNTYVRAFDHGSKRKYELVRELIKPGRIVDIGCCTGALLGELTRDPGFRESDFYGIEIARPLFAECLHRKEQGIFGSENVFFYQQNIAERPVFADHTVNTFTTFALTHEIESYSSREALRRFIGLLHQQLAINGRWVNVDVVGPRNRLERILMQLNRRDGRNEDYERSFSSREQLKDYLDGLSTYARFKRFSIDFRQDEGYTLPFQELEIDGKNYIELTMQDACEFMSKKDYSDNWISEMHETFCFWDFQEWQQALTEAGFRISTSSYEFTNPWIVENRLAGKVNLFRHSDKGIEPVPYPVTNMVLVAEK